MSSKSWISWEEVENILNSNNVEQESPPSSNQDIINDMSENYSMFDYDPFMVIITPPIYVSNSSGSIAREEYRATNTPC